MTCRKASTWSASSMPPPVAVLQSLKDFCTRALSPHRSNPAVKPRGILLLSPPGCGKSAFCKALGNEVGRLTLILDIGALMGSLVGQSEANLRQALRQI